MTGFSGGGGGGKHADGVGCKPFGRVKKLLATSNLLRFCLQPGCFVFELVDYVCELVSLDLVAVNCHAEM
jgi:hypothetical protein